MTLAALGMGIWNWKAERAWRAYRAGAESAGEKLMLPQVIPPPIPEGGNLAMTPFLRPLFDYETRDGNTVRKDEPGWTRVVTAGKGAFRQSTSRPGMKVPAAGNWRLGHPTDLVAWQDYYAAAKEFPTPQAPGRPGADIILALGESSDALAELRGALSRPRCWFPVHYADANPAGILLPHLSVIKRMHGYLALWATAQLSEHQPDIAARDLEIAFRLQRGIEQEPMLISYLVNIASLQIYLHSLWEGCIRHEWSADQLARFQAQLGETDCLEGLKRAIRGERAFGNAIYERWLSNRGTLGSDWAQFQDVVPNDGRPQGLAAPGLLGYLFPRGLLRENQLLQNQYASAMLAGLGSLGSPAGNYHRIDLEAVTASAHGLLKPPGYRNILVSMLAPALDGVVSKGLLAQASRDVALAGIAIERYRLAKGEYPERLEQLTPEFLPSLPKDVYTGEPLHYRRDSKDLFMLYSVGPNGQDDHGVWPHTEQAARGGQRGGAAPDDVVWRYVTPE
ncbi:MAG TPA: hypothetical protein DCM86_15510 [Verrucomicrobiales bacterium]|nr:hypothetical protein [Verrucomicrobiales bacterium]